MNRLLTIIMCFSLFAIHAQDKKSLNIERTNTPPKIDGVLDDDVWMNAQEATGFVQFRPEMGVTLEPHQQTIVKMTYDDNAIYVGAYLKDKPEDIQKQLTSRDNFGNADFFGVMLNPNNDAQNDTEFFVFSSGTQADAVASPGNGEDFGWSAVWDSAVKIVDDGWIVEMKIPYRALRFSNDEIQTWGIQFHRRFRLDNSQYTWNPIDRSQGNIGLYHAELTGIKNITPPTRLSFYPFVSGIATSFDGKTETDLKVGLDLKYGITENFTLDATLIPDFSQAAFDNVSLNLGPFEQTFGEQRQFFKEGVDLFNKGNLFFSRRIGNRPSQRNNVYNELVDANDISEEVIDNPREVKVLNAIKVSGRTKNGLGIGVFNAITEKTEATILTKEYIRNPNTQVITDSIFSYRNRTTEPLTNYNILVVDKQFNGNSSVSFINTNVTRNGHFRDGNVTGLLADLSNKRNTYNIRGQLKMSVVNPGDQVIPNTGLSSFFMVRKTHGKYRYSFDHSFANAEYDINDIGLNFRNNYSNFGVDASYQIFEPTEKLNNFRINTWFNYRMLYKPSTYTGSNFGINMNAQTKKLLWFGSSINFETGTQYDYFEPRDFENKRFFTYKNIGNIEGWFETNGTKKLSLEFFAYGFHAFDKERTLGGFGFGIEPTYRISDKFRINYDFTYRDTGGSRGFVNRIDDDIIFGERDILSIENQLSGNYTFNPYHSLSLAFRNFWSTVTYDEALFVLQDDGSLNTDDGYTTASVDDPNVNFNTWNLDLSYTWQVAPGSFLTALYRNQLDYRNTMSEETFFDSVGTLFDQPIRHTFSLRLQYFLDYNEIKNVFKGNNRKLKSPRQPQGRYGNSGIGDINQQGNLLNRVM